MRSYSIAFFCRPYSAVRFKRPLSDCHDLGPRAGKSPSPRKTGRRVVRLAVGGRQVSGFTKRKAAAVARLVRVTSAGRKLHISGTCPTRFNADLPPSSSPHRRVSAVRFSFFAAVRPRRRSHRARSPKLSAVTRD